MSEDFLSRWSRRKLEVRREQEPGRQQDASAPAEPEAHAPEQVRAKAGAPEPTPEEEVRAEAGAPELTPEEIAALPPIEELTAESDFSLFLRKGVPERLKNAALRRMWSLDPAIRDYVGDARDYAWDWNVPGGVPGSGPLRPSEVGELLRGMFGDAEQPRPVAATETARDPVRRSGSAQAAGAPPREDSAGPAAKPAQDAAAEAPDAPAPAAREALAPEAGRASSRTAGAAAGPDFAENRAENRPPRRHGGAKPA
ncbi:MAG TPA: DUF3306 domain-containing protein [Microvirga sp.]|nr:DUF3306 domain-containing protein [Microvirga sp.]